MPLWGLPLHSTSPNEAFSRSKDAECDFFSFLPVFKKAVILVYRDNNKMKKKMVRGCARVLPLGINGIKNITLTFFFFCLFFCVCMRVCDQNNPRSALSHGDPDPFKFRWLIPLSALQVRLGNTAGKTVKIHFGITRVGWATWGNVAS